MLVSSLTFESKSEFECRKFSVLEFDVYSITAVCEIHDSLPPRMIIKSGGLSEISAFLAPLLAARLCHISPHKRPKIMKILRDIEPT